MTVILSFLFAWGAWAAPGTPPWIGTVTVSHVVAAVSPDNTFAVLTSALDSARSWIHTSVYQLDNPELGAAFDRALSRGVEVTILLEGSPIPKIPENELAIAERLERKGAHIQFYARAADSERGKRTFRYFHAKYTVIDGLRVAVGSANYGLNGHPTDNTFGNREWEVVLDDASAAELFEAAFEHDAGLGGEWARFGSSARYGAGRKFDWRPHPFDGGGRHSYEPRLASPYEARNVPVKTVFAPDNTINGPLAGVLNDAARTIDVEQLNLETYWGGKPYNPRTEESPVVEALVKSARLGRRVRVLLNDDRVFRGGGEEDLLGRVGRFFWGADPLDWDPLEDGAENEALAGNRDNAATLAYLNRLASRESLHLEVRLFDYRGCGLNVLHNKGMVVDGTITFVGSLNWGESAMKFNREAGVLLKDAGIAQYYSSAFEYDWSCSGGRSY